MGGLILLRLDVIVYFFLNEHEYQAAHEWVDGILIANRKSVCWAMSA